MGYAEILHGLKIDIDRGDGRGQYLFSTHAIFCVSHRIINNICFIIYFPNIPSICKSSYFQTFDLSLRRCHNLKILSLSSKLKFISKLLHGSHHCNLFK